MTNTVTPLIQLAAPASPPVESKHDKFLRLATARINKAMDDIRLIGQLATRSYQHEAWEAKLLVETLGQSVSTMAMAFSIPFAFKVGNVGQVEATIDVFDEAKATASSPEELNKIKISVALALDKLAADDLDGTREILVDLL